MNRFLLVFDADHIKEYVFATGRLREIRGASELVRDASSTQTLLQVRELGLSIYNSATAEGELIYAAGGSGLLLLKSRARADHLAGLLARHYRDKTSSGHLSTASVEWQEDKGESIGSATARAAAKLRLVKAALPLVGAPSAGGAIAVCDSCRREPRAYNDSVDGRMLCATCADKRAASGRVRGKLPQQPFWHSFTHDMPPKIKQAWQSTEVLDATARDFHAVAARGRPSGYLGFCYADGDGMGKLLAKATTPAVYRELSLAIEDSVVGAVGQALRENYAHINGAWLMPASYLDEGRPGHPFEVIAVGGDDVILVTSANRALPVALAYCHAFADQLSARLTSATNAVLKQWWSEHGAGQQPSASAGVLIAHDTLPTLTLADRSLELLRSAKRARQWLDSNSGAIDFHLVSTPSLEAVSSVRRVQYQASADVGLTMRPYSLADLEDLLQLAQRVRQNIATNKQADLYKSLFQEPFAAVLDLLRLQGRLGVEGRQVLFSAAERFNWHSHYPYGNARAGSHLLRSTGLIDLLEVAGLDAALVQEEA